MNKVEKGRVCEQDFHDRIRKEDIPIIWLNEWVDFLVKGYPFEVKSTQLYHKFSAKNRKGQQYKIGRFMFTKEQQAHDLWVAFYVTHGNEYMFLGIGKVPKNNLYVSLGRVREMELMTVKEFVEFIKHG